MLARFEQVCYIIRKVTAGLLGLALTATIPHMASGYATIWHAVAIWR